MTNYSVNIEKVTPEIKRILEQLGTLSGVTITPDTGAKAKSKSAWDTAIAEGAVSVDEFIGELRRQVDEHFAKNA